MAGNFEIKNANGKKVTLRNPDSNNKNIVVDISDIAKQTYVDSLVLSVPTSYHLLQGNLAVDNTVITQGFNTTLYTGNGSTQSINTGIDMTTQWGNDASETFGGLVWLKSRSNGTYSHRLFNSVMGATKSLVTDSTSAEITDATSLTAFSSSGFSLGTLANINGVSNNMVSWNFQTTHRISGVTNHGKPYTCHYNPYTGFTIVKYEGSGIAGHEIPHHLGRKLGFAIAKNLSSAIGWEASYNNGYALTLNSTTAQVVTTSGILSKKDSYTSIGTDTTVNVSGSSYIIYGWANSYFDEANKLIGNYEIGVYQGTGAAGNKVKTRGKPAWLMYKRLDSNGSWLIYDNKRINDGYWLLANTSEVEGTTQDDLNFNIDGFTLNVTNADRNASGGQYLYMVVYDTNSDGGGSYYPKTSDTAHVQINNALIPIAKGSDTNGLKNAMLSKNESITGLTYTAGKNYIYYDGNGNKGVKSIAPNYGTTNPANGGDFYNVLENKWYTSADVEIPEGRNYLNHIVHADNDGGVLYVEELPKIEYKDVIKANKYQGKNACTAWVRVDMTTTPPTVKDSFNIDKVIRTATGVGELYFDFKMDSVNYSVVGAGNNGGGSATTISMIGGGVDKFQFQSFAGTTLTNLADVHIQIFGGKN